MLHIKYFLYFCFTKKSGCKVRLKDGSCDRQFIY